jgi:hypothetical protein
LSGLEQAWAKNRTKICRDFKIFAQQGLFLKIFFSQARFCRDLRLAHAQIWPKMSGFSTGKTQFFSKIRRDRDQAFGLVIRGPDFSELSGRELCGGKWWSGRSKINKRLDKDLCVGGP